MGEGEGDGVSESGERGTGLGRGGFVFRVGQAKKDLFSGLACLKRCFAVFQMLCFETRVSVFCKTLVFPKRCNCESSAFQTVFCVSETRLNSKRSVFKTLCF